MLAITLSAVLGGAYAAGGAARANELATAGSLPTGHTAAEHPVATIAPINAAQRVSFNGTAPASVDASLAVPAAAPFHGADAGAGERDCLTTAVYYEARGETPAGQAAVAQVILNRVRNPLYPKSICGVVFQGVAQHDCQFSFACDGAMNGRRDPAAWSRARQVAERALHGFVMANVGSATNFHATAVSPSWGGMVRVCQIGAHVFYRLGGNVRLVAYQHPAQAERIMRVADNADAAPSAARPHYTLLGPSSGEARLVLASGRTSAPAPQPSARPAPEAVTANKASPTAIASATPPAASATPVVLASIAAAS